MTGINYKCAKLSEVVGQKPNDKLPTLNRLNLISRKLSENRKRSNIRLLIFRWRTAILNLETHSEMGVGRKADIKGHVTRRLTLK